MSVGIIGTVRASDVNINDIDIYYNYTPNRETINNAMFKLNAADVLTETFLPDDEKIVGSENLMGGIYNLKLPTTTFNQLGIYTIYLKPKTYTIVIDDCGVLSSLPNIKGIVINSNSISESLRGNNALQGYMIEYIDNNGKKMRNTVRYVVSSNKVIPINENVGNTSQKAIRYRFDDAGTLLFLQLTPSTASDVKPNLLPFIGYKNQKIILSNTFFSPTVVEVNLVENTIDSLSEYIMGEQIKDVQTGTITHYDSNRVITKQENQYVIKDSVTDVPLYEVREKKENIDFSQDFEDIISGI